MHLVVRDVSVHPEVDGVDDLVVSVLFVAIEVLGLAAVTWRAMSVLTLVCWRGKNAPE
jgi:hypothetical protein